MKTTFRSHLAHMKESAGLGPNPVFDDGERVFVKGIFRIPRPNRHFVGNRPGNDVRPIYQSPFTDSLGDVDNLSKFVLDAMNGVMYGDDRQVAALLAIKCNDDDVSNGGSTDLSMATISNDELRTLMNL